MSQTKKKSKSIFDSPIWAKVKTFLKTLVSNMAAAGTAQRSKMWTAIVLAVISVIISLVPLTVHQIQVKGESFLTNSSYNYNFDQTLYTFLEDAKANNYDITFSDGKASLTGKTTSNNLIYEHTTANLDGHSSTKKDFQVYFVNETGDAFNSTYTKLLSEDPNNKSYRDCSFMVFGKDVFAVVLYNGLSSSVTTSMSGDYVNLRTYTNFTKLLSNASTDRSVNLENTLNNFKTFINEAYENVHVRYIWIQIGIAFALNAGVTILMVFVLFLLTRGKSNPNKHVKLLGAAKITGWCTLSPAILALGVGFFFVGYETLIYVLLFGFRIMWLSMKEIPLISDK